MDGTNRRFEIGGCQLDRQDQDGRANDGHSTVAVPRSGFRLDRYSRMGRTPAVDRLRIDGLVHVLLPAPGLAFDQGKGRQSVSGLQRVFIGAAGSLKVYKP